MFAEVPPKKRLIFYSEEDMDNYFKNLPPRKIKEKDTRFCDFVAKQLVENNKREKYIEYKKNATPVLEGTQKLEKPRYVGKIWKHNERCGHKYCVGKNTKEEKELLVTKDNKTNLPCKDCQRWSREDEEFKKQIGEFRFGFHLYHNKHFYIPKEYGKIKIPSDEEYKTNIEPKYYHWLYVDRDLKSYKDYSRETINSTFNW